MTADGGRGVLGGRFARRITAAFAATALVAAALTAILVNVAFGVRFDEYLDAQQQARQQQVLTALGAAYQRGGTWQAEVLDEVGAGLAMSGATVVLIDASGTKLWASTDSPRSSAMVAMHQQMMGAPELTASRSLPVVVGGRTVGIAQVRVPAAALPTLDTRFRGDVNLLLLVGAVAAAALALLAGAVFARRATAGVVELTAAADDLAGGQRDRRARVSSRDEIGQLARSFNAMADAVGYEDALRRAFAGDVAHELRTPLTVLRSQLEAVQDGISEPTALVIDSLHEQTLRLVRLVADLATMADAGAAAFTLELHQIELQKLVTEVVDDFTGYAADRELELHTALTEAVVTADAARMRQITENLLGNAAKFSPPGARVTVTLQERDGFVELAVSDTGAGIPSDELPYVFDRFFRGADARAGGSGIGLAVVAELVAAHGGTVSVDSEVGRGSRFRVRLPTHPQQRSSNAHTSSLTSPMSVNEPRGQGATP